MAAEQFLSIPLEIIPVGEQLPVVLYVYLDFRFITFRAEGDMVDRNAYDRLDFRKVKNLFINDRDRQRFEAWIQELTAKEEPLPEAPPAIKDLKDAREDAHRQTMDIFQAEHPDKMISQVMNASRKLVFEVMKFPFATKTLAQLQTYSKGTVDHSVNVSVLSVYLAMQMGYSHQQILQHVGMGGLLHDIGKTKIKITDEMTPAEIELKMKDHPAHGLRILEAIREAPSEVQMIVAQHHENYDGTGFPRKLRGNAIYDLARIVSIANVFDELVGDGRGTLAERQRTAFLQLDQVIFKRFEPQKLEKALRILKQGV